MISERHKHIKEELERELYPAELTDILSSIPKLTEVEAIFYNYADEMEQREKESNLILKCKETDLNMNKYLDDLLYTQTGIEKLLVNIKKDIKANKYKNEDLEDIRLIIDIETSRNSLDENKKIALKKYLTLAGIFKEDEKIKDINDRLKLANYMGLLRRTLKANGILNYEKAYQIYKQDYIKEKIKADTPTYKPGNTSIIPADNFTKEIMKIAGQPISQKIIENWFTVVLRKKDKRLNLEQITGRFQYKNPLGEALENVCMNKKDFHVALAICSLWDKGIKEFKINDVLSEMTGSNTARIKDIETDERYKMITNSIHKQRIIYITFIDNAVFNKNIKAKVDVNLLEDNPLLKFETKTKINKRGTITQTIKLLEKPVLLALYGDYMQQYERVNIIKHSLPATVNNLIIESALRLIIGRYKRISKSKSKKLNKDNNRLNIESFLLDEAGIDIKDRQFKNNKNKLIYNIGELLKAHKEAGNIKSYEPIRDNKMQLEAYTITINGNKEDEAIKQIIN